MSRRLYLGRLPPDTRTEDVNDLFKGYGRITDCRVMTGFGFVEFESSKDAEDAVNNFNGKEFMGSTIAVEFAKESRPRRDPYEDRGRGGDGSRSRRPPGIRVIVSNVSRDTSWQDLKDFGRDAGNVSFADVDRDVPGQGILEYMYRDDANRAVKELDGKDLRGRAVTVAFDESRSGPDNYKREDRGDRYRRDRSRSPPRRDDDRRHRSPPRRDYDDRRSGGYDDRRAPYERRDSDRRKDDRRRDDKEDRYDDRRPPNGEGSWSR